MSICTLTASAQEQINALCKENNCFGISLNIKGGGCAGFEYDWGIVKSNLELEPNDEVISAGTGNFIIGYTSVMYLIGMELDYKKSLVGSNFEIRNPNAKSSCGCGTSVNFDFDAFDYDTH
jgi:iron-sulfur cluster assembly accessory protein